MAAIVAKTPPGPAPARADAQHGVHRCFRAPLGSDAAGFVFEEEDGAEVGFVCRCNEAATGTERAGKRFEQKVARGEGPAHIRDGDGRALWPAVME